MKRFPRWLRIAYIATPVVLLSAVATMEAVRLAPSDLRAALKAVRDAPADPETRRQLGDAYFRHGLYARAAREYGQVLILRPYDMDAAWSLYEAAMAAGQTRQAAWALERCVRLDALSERGARAIEGLRKLGYAELILPAVEAFVRSQPENEAAHRLLAQLYANAGKYLEAAAEYRRVLELKPGSPTALYGLGEASEKLGMWLSAAMAYKDYTTYDTQTERGRHARAFVSEYFGRRLPRISEEVRGLLDRWVQAQNSGEVAAYRALYSDEFCGYVSWCDKDGLVHRWYVPDLDTWMKRRRSKIEQRAYRIEAGRPAIEDHWSEDSEECVRVRFRQEFRSESYAEVGEKVMKLVRVVGGGSPEAGRWHVLFEDSESCRRIEDQRAPAEQSERQSP